MVTKIVHGIVRGKLIELDEELGIAEGQQVELQVKVIPTAPPWGEGILRTAGALKDDPYWDAIMEEVHQSRKLERRPLSDEP